MTWKWSFWRAASRIGCVGGIVSSRSQRYASTGYASTNPSLKIYASTRVDMRVWGIRFFQSPRDTIECPDGKISELWMSCSVFRYGKNILGWYKNISQNFLRLLKNHNENRWRSELGKMRLRHANSINFRSKFGPISSNLVKNEKHWCRESWKERLWHCEQCSPLLRGQEKHWLWMMNGDGTAN